ncbi:MAG: hypothetical protein MO852_15345, partial [Candidatus Devosia euplotis]|nr:hypothetical protein [Candidatus Devosia euplotis]
MTEDHAIEPNLRRVAGLLADLSTAEIDLLRQILTAVGQEGRRSSADLSRLSDRDRQVYDHLVLGRTAKQMALIL